MSEIELVVDSIRVSNVDDSSKKQKFMVLLKEKNGERYLPFKISEFYAINLGGLLRHQPLIEFQMPMLYIETLNRFSLLIKSIVITGISGNSFNAKIAVGDIQEERFFWLKCSAIDALILALKAEKPIYAEEKLLIIARPSNE